MAVISLLHQALAVFLVWCTCAEAWVSRSEGSRIKPGKISHFATGEPRDLNNDNVFSVLVSYGGRNCEVEVWSNETLLSGLERAGVSDRLAIPELPSECRRGNCLTCVGCHSTSSSKTSLQRFEDGLSPYISREVSKRGFFLTCSSRVIGEGLRIELGKNNVAWKEMHSDRLQEESVQLLGREAVAKTIRLHDEKNLPRWAEETKRSLERSGGE